MCDCEMCPPRKALRARTGLPLFTAEAVVVTRDAAVDTETPEEAADA